MARCWTLKGLAANTLCYGSIFSTLFWAALEGSILEHLLHAPHFMNRILLLTTAPLWGRKEHIRGLRHLKPVTCRKARVMKKNTKWDYKV